MFAEIITSKVRKELNKMNFYYSGEILPLKVINDVWLLNVYNEDKTFIIRYYDFDNADYYINKYLIMEKYGIKMPEIICYSDKLIIFEDYNDINKYDKLNIESISRENIEKISDWYKNLHSKFDESIINYKDYFSAYNVNKIMKKYNLQNNKNMKYIYDNFYNINLKISRLKSNFVLNNFCLDNMLVYKKNGDVVCNNFDTIENGFCYLDISKIKEVFDEEKYDIFIKRYGFISDDEIAIGEVASKLIDLYLFVDEEIVPVKIRKILDEVVTEKFENKIKSIVEWY